MLALFAALGLIQAGLIDQSLFAADYMGYEGWVENRVPTLVPALGISVHDALSFVVGHMVFSFGAPIALAEAWSPRQARTPWLGRVGTVVGLLGYLGAAALILGDPASRTGSVGQLLGAGGAVMVLVLVAAALGRSRGRRSSARRALPLGLVVLVAAVVATIPDQVPPTWIGVSIWVLVLVIAGSLLTCASIRTRWSVRHCAAAGLGVLLARGLAAFTYFPLLGEVSAAAKYAHNAVMLLAVLAAGWVALRLRATADPGTGGAAGRGPFSG